MKGYNDFINDYLKELRNEYFLKEHNIIENSHKQIFTHKENNSFLSLKDILTKNYIIQDSLKQNEINSINEIQKDKYIIFQTTTIDPILNHRKNINDVEELENNIINQYKEFSKYFKYINMTNDKKNLNYKNIRTYELTKSLNTHSHKLDFLENKKDIIKYIESLMLSKNKFKVGRIELSLDFEYFEEIKKYFDNKEIKIRVNNKYIILTLVKRTFNNQLFYYIKESKKGNGNFIYFRTIEKQDEKDKQHLTKYLFKYMLKTFHKNEDTEKTELKPKNHVSNEILIFSKLKLKQKIFSENFFTDKLNKEYLEKLNGKFFTLFKQKENNKKNVLDYITKTDLEFIENNKNKMFYTLGKLLNENKLIFQKSKNTIEQEYKKIKSLVRIKINEYDDKKKKNFIHLIYKDYISSNFLTNKEFNERFFKEIKEYLKNHEQNRIFLKSYNEVFDKETEYFDYEYKEEIQDEKLIIQLTQIIFKFFNSKFNYQDTEDEIYYFNEEQEELILIHSFKSNYEFEKHNNNLELYYTLLKNNVFNNEQEEKENKINFINSLLEYLEIEDRISFSTMDEERLEGIRLQREEQNERIEALIDSKNDEDMGIFNKDLLNYLYSLTDIEIEDFIIRNDTEIIESIS